MPEPPRGFFRQIGRTSGAFGADLARFVALRVELAALEGHEARVGAVRSLVVLGIAVAAIAWADLFASAAAIAWIADRYAIDWWWVAMAAAALHLVAGGLLLVSVRARSRRGYFTETVRQFRRDREWLEAQSAADSTAPPVEPQ